LDVPPENFDAAKSKTRYGCFGARALPLLRMTAKGGWGDGERSAAEAEGRWARR
jgi:hypothetical protein